MNAKHLFVCLPLVSVLSIAALEAAAQRGDYGDAPDDGPSQYPMMFETSSDTGRFPTLYATSNSRYGNPGIHHLATDQEWFGPMDAPPSRETDANDLVNDEDIHPNLVDMDGHDNGLPRIPFFISLTQMPPAAALSYHISVPAGAADVPRYVNVLIDWDQDGQWKQSLVSGAVTEWVVRNHTINLPPGNTQLFTSPAFLWGWHALLAPQCFWMRMTISQVPLDPNNYPDGWDGAGSFPTGETEDHLFQSGYSGDPDDNPVSRKRPSAGAGPPVPPPPAPAGRKRPRPKKTPSLVILPKFQTVPHGTTAMAHVVKVPSTHASPVLSGWRVGPGTRGGSFDLGSPTLPVTNGMAYPSGPYLAQATWGAAVPGAPAGTLNTILISSVLDARLPAMEYWPLEVTGTFSGKVTQTAKGTVTVLHSQIPMSVGTPVSGGIPGVYLGGTRTVDWSVIAEPERTTALDLLEQSRLDFEGGLLAAARVKLADLRTLITEPPGLTGITAEEETRLLGIIDFLEPELSAIEAVHGAVPVPVIEWPTDGEDVAGIIELLVTHLYPAVDVDSATFEMRDPGTGDWLPLGGPAPTNPEPGQWLQEIDTAALPDGIRDFRVTLTDERMPGPEDDRMSQATVALRIDNTPPSAPTLTMPASAQLVGSSVHLEASAIAEEASVASAEISSDGTTWVEMATDYDVLDGWSFDVDTGSLPGGSYWLRVTCSDDAENETSSLPVEVIVSPSYPSWALERGVTSDTEDADGDSIPAILEYYADLNPQEWDSPVALQMIVENSGDDFVLRCRRREFYDGLSVVVEASSDLGIGVPWAPIAVDPPRDPSGRIEVVLPPGPRQFGRLRFDP